MGIAAALTLLLAGALIGATGIGGVLVVPALTRLAGMEPAEAIAVSALGFGFPALHAFWLLRSRPPEHARAVRPLVFAALGGAAMGALLVHSVPANALLAGVTALVLFAGVRGLLATGAPPSSAAPPGTAPMAAAGFAVGLGSALTGTGGPILLLPLLMLWNQPLAFTVAAAQAIQLPVAAASITVHALAGSLDWPRGLLVGVLLLAGSLAGHRLARGVRVRLLQIAVSLLLLATGLWFGWRLFGS